MASEAGSEDILGRILRSMGGEAPPPAPVAAPKVAAPPAPPDVPHTSPPSAAACAPPAPGIEPARLDALEKMLTETTKALQAVADEVSAVRWRGPAEERALKAAREAEGQSSAAEHSARLAEEAQSAALRAVERVGDKLGEAVSRLDALSRRRDDDSREMSELREATAKMFETLARSDRRTAEAIARLEEGVGAFLERLTAEAAREREAWAAARAAADLARASFESLGPRQDILDRTGALLDRQQETERRVSDAFKIIAQKDALLSRLSLELREKLKGNG